MAEMGYGCVFGDCLKAPNHLITTINPSATVTLCDEHYAPGLIPLLAAELGVDPGDFYANVERYVNRKAKDAERALADAQAQEAAKGSQGPAPGHGVKDEPESVEPPHVDDMNAPAAPALGEKA